MTYPNSLAARMDVREECFRSGERAALRKTPHQPVSSPVQGRPFVYTEMALQGFISDCVVTLSYPLTDNLKVQTAAELDLWWETLRALWKAEAQLEVKDWSAAK